jgi:hypothetical protein
MHALDAPDDSDYVPNSPRHGLIIVILFPSAFESRTGFEMLYYQCRTAHTTARGPHPPSRDRRGCNDAEEKEAELKEAFEGAEAEHQLYAEEFNREVAILVARKRE